ncbi:porin family protein [Ferruginibacter sp.]
MKKVLLMLGLSLLTSLSYAQANFIYKNGTSYPEKDFRKEFGCKDDETIEQCQTRLRNDTLRREDSIKREAERLKYDEAKSRRARWELEKERRDKLTPEERRKEDEDRRLASEGEKKKKTEDGIDFLAGAIYSNKSGNYPNYNPVLGMLIGVQTQVISLSDYVGLGIGINYSMQGGKYESSDYVPGGNYSTTSRTSRLSYLNFPVMVRYQRQRAGFFAEAGVQPGLLLSAKDKGTNTNDIKDEIKKFDVGIPIGVGYKFKNKIGVGLRLTPGLININKDEQYKNRNMVASMRASYTL